MSLSYTSYVRISDWFIQVNFCQIIVSSKPGLTQMKVFVCLRNKKLNKNQTNQFICFFLVLLAVSSSYGSCASLTYSKTSKYGR